MPFEHQTTRKKGTHHTKKELPPPAQDNIIGPGLSKKRRRDETETEMLATQDKKERKRRKKEEKAKQGALEEEIQPISPVQELGPAIRDTSRGETKEVENQKDGKKVGEPLVEVCLPRYSMSNVPDRQRRFRRLNRRRSRRRRRGKGRKRLWASSLENYK